MLKLFRKIRYDLMEKNQKGKYLKYAIGEIVLVVIGILIALQINTWNEERIAGINEQLALKNLRQDFTYNYQTLDSTLTSVRENIAVQFRILDHTGNKPEPISRTEFNKCLNRLADINEYYPRNGYLDDLVNSGSLGIIKNQELRNKLSSWSPTFEYIKSRERELETARDRVSNMIISKGSWLNADAVSITETVMSNHFPESGFEVDNRVLLKELAFENNTENTIYQNDKLSQSHVLGLALIAEILELLDQEID